MKRTIRRSLPPVGVPIGFVAGRPVYPILGASEDDSSNGGEGGEGSGESGEELDPAALLDRLEAAKKVNRDLERKLKADPEGLRRELSKTRKELEALREARATDPGEAPDIEALVAEQVKDQVSRAEQAANERLKRSEIKAAAVGKLADPKDALLYLDLDSFEVASDGSIDEAGIAAAIDDLIKTKPYLAAQGAGGGSGDGGVRNGRPKPRDFDSEIAEAQKARQFDRVVALRREQHAAATTT